MAGENLHGYTYSYQDVSATIQGPGGNFSLGQGAGAAAEGMTVTLLEEKDTMVTGADGTVMHSLRAGQSGRITVRLQRTSPVNRLLSQLYDFQRQFTPNWGKNIISIQNVAQGDQSIGHDLAFVKYPDFSYATEAGMVEWEFQGIVDTDIGAGVAGLASAVTAS